MANINIGTLSGRIELQDRFSSKIRAIGTRVDTLKAKIKSAARSGAASFGKMFGAFVTGALVTQAIQSMIRFAAMSDRRAPPTMWCSSARTSQRPSSTPQIWHR